MLSDWRSGRSSPVLRQGDVHIWRVTTAQAAERWQSLLSADERHRASAFKNETDRSRYVVAHGAARTILGRYTSVRPEDLVFVEGRHGKPSLAGNATAEFNLSHSGNLALLAVSHTRAVGIDVVQHDGDVDHAGIAQRVFSAAERAAIESAVDRVTAFYMTWARKEAGLKARGLGLAIPASDLDPDQWDIVDIGALDGYSAALVVAKPAGAISLFDFES